MTVFVFANVTTDGTVGSAQSLPGPDYQISHDLGTTKGQNLFHSFHDFSIAKGESATFTGPDSIANVISRVTGGEVSSIDGLLRSEVGQADFFFINPAGVVFGPNAQVDVPGAFHVTTADELRFSDGNVFSGTNPDTSSLTMAEPASFGFLSPQSASIVLNGAKLVFAPETTIGLAGGDVSIIGSEIGEAVLSSQGGEILIRAVGDVQGEVPISGQVPFDMKGKVFLESAGISSSGNKGGKIEVQAGEMELIGATLVADNTGEDASDGGIEMLVDGDLIISHGSRVQSNVFDKGNSGKIQVEADNILIEQIGDEPFTGIFSEVETGAKGDAGGIVINALDDFQIQGVGGITSCTYGVGHAGDVQVNATNMVVDGQGRSIPYREIECIAGISSETWFESTGDAGKVMIDVANHLYLLNSGAVSSSTNGAGNAGDVLVNAGILTIDSQDSGWFTGFSSEPEFGSTGHAGRVDIKVDGMLAVLNGGLISSGTYSESDAGDVNISAGSLHINGQNSEWFTGISSQANSELAGHSGSIEIKVNQLLEILSGGSVSSDTYSESDAGDVKISAGSLHINGQNSEWFTGISSQANLESGGHAGNIEVNVNEMLEILNGARISSNTYSGEDAGKIVVNAGNLTIERQNSDFVTGIFSYANSGSKGNAGSVDLTVDGLLQIVSGGTIASSTFSDGDAGKVIINTGNLSIDRQGSDSVTGILSDANSGSSGNAGKVEIMADELLEILNGGQISSDTFSGGDAGEVIINAGSLTIDRQSSDSVTGIFSDTNSGSTGNAGKVEIMADELLEILNGGQISSDTFSGGDAGEVVINAGSLTIDRQNSDSVTGIFSDTNSGSTGNAGKVEIMADELLEILNGGQISSDTFYGGDAGEVVINAGSLTIDRQSSDSVTGIFSDTNSGSTGNAGRVEVNVYELLEILNGGQISSDTFYRGDAGEVVINAGSLTIDRQGSNSLTGVFSIAKSGSTGSSGSVEIRVNGLLEILNGARISSDTFSKGDAGAVMINAGTLSIDRQESDSVTGIFSYANLGSKGNAGSVDVTVEGLLQILNGGTIASSTFSDGDAGKVNINTGKLSIDKRGSDSVTGILSQANPESRGDAGSVNVTVKDLLQIVSGGTIACSTFSDGNAGKVIINTGNLSMNGQGSDFVTGIFSNTNSGSTGSAGGVEVRVDVLLEILNGAQISSMTFSKGNAGEVVINAGGLIIDRQESGFVTGILSQANSESKGDAGSVDVTVEDLLQIVSGGTIASSTFSDGDAGKVIINTGNLSMDGQGSDLVTGIFSDANSGATGNAGCVEVKVADLLKILNGARISSMTFSKGNAGEVVINAGGVIIDRQGSDFVTGILSQADPESKGDAGSIDVTVGNNIRIVNGGAIGNSTFSEGNAGKIVINTGRLTIDRQGSDSLTGIFSDTESGATGDAGTVDVTVNELLEILNGARISSDTFSGGNAGEIVVNAGTLTIDKQNTYVDTGIFSGTKYGSTGHAGRVDITVSELLRILNGGQISSSTWSDGDAGNVKIRAEELNIDSLKSSLFTGIFSQSDNFYSKGNAGIVEVDVRGKLEIIGDAAYISSATSGQGKGGKVFVQADSLLIDANAGVGGIKSATAGSGDAGTVDIAVNGLMELLDGGVVYNSSFSEGDAGNVTIHAGEIRISGAGYYNSGFQSDTYGKGNAGIVNVSANGYFEILNGAEISTGTWSEGHAGSVVINAGELTINSQGSKFLTGIFSQANAVLSGNAGGVEVDVSGKLEIIGDTAYISSATFGQGKGGEVVVKADSLLIDVNNGSGGITSETNGSGYAGTVDIDIKGLMELLNGAKISSGTWSEGHAGSMVVNAEALTIDSQGSEVSAGIFSQANEGSTGYVGNISILADQIKILNNGKISIASLSSILEMNTENTSDIQERSIKIDVNRLLLDQGAQITAESSGSIPAADIDMNIGKLFVENGSSITTSAQEADGGRITIRGNSMVLRNGLITTSVETGTGNGGNIFLTGPGEDQADALVLNGGFIQANTGAATAHGGNIFINTRALIAQGNQLEVGGNERQSFESGKGLNIIQAAAPGGEQGTINITAPELDISGSLVNTAIDFFQPARLATDPCSVAGGQGISSLIFGGQGGLPGFPEQPLGIFFGEERVDRLLEENKKNPFKRLLK